MKFDKVNLIKCTTLAYVGDAVFTLYVRARLGADPHLPNRALINGSAKMVSAVVQSKIFERISDLLDEEELSLAQRCYNAHTNNKAKNATAEQYRKATALEGLLGALYLSDEKTRLGTLLDDCFEIGESL